MHDSVAPLVGGRARRFGAAPLPAQTDFRNLDEARPIRTEDALPVDHYGWRSFAADALEAEARPGSI